MYETYFSVKNKVENPTEVEASIHLPGINNLSDINLDIGKVYLMF